MATDGEGSSSKKAELYTYEAEWPIFGMNWSHKKSRPFRLAIGSFIEEYTNKVQFLELDEDAGKFAVHSTIDHPYPTTKIMWIPDLEDTRPDLVATTGDYLRIWRVGEGKTSLECLLNSNKTSEFCAPLTSFDWNEADPNIIGTASIDTTCTIWNVTAEKAVARIGGEVKTQLIAHDQEVYDMAFCRGDTHSLASVGADGSVRLFDLRKLEHSTIIYDNEDNSPLLRLAWNKEDSNYLATVAMDSNEVILLDIRYPCIPVSRLGKHEGPINGIAWAPHSSCHICTASDDRKALIWDIQNVGKGRLDPILAYEAGGPINQCRWSAAETKWISITYDRHLEILRV